MAFPKEHKKSKMKYKNGESSSDSVGSLQLPVFSEVPGQVKAGLLLYLFITQ